MQIQLNEAVKKEKAEGQARLEKAVRETEERLVAYYTQVEKEAREEERRIAADEAARVAK